MNKENTYKLIVPIEIGTDNVIEELHFSKPNLGQLTKVKSMDSYQRSLEMIVACCDQPTIVIKRLEYDDAIAIIEEFLPDFLGITDDQD